MPIVFFDLDGTLLDNSADFRAVFVGVLGRHGVAVSGGEMSALLDTCWPWYEEHVGAHRDDEMSFWLRFNTRVAREAGAGGRAGAVGRAITDAFQALDAPRLYPDVLPTLDRVAALGYRLGVITARPDARRVLLPLGILERFEILVDAFTAGSAKQDATAFRFALAKAGAAPEQAVHIGDQPARDVIPAQDAGLSAVLLDREDRYAEMACSRVPDLFAFQHWLAEWQRSGAAS
jgi:putative hydrolase of the HAD superfamily